MEGKIHQGIKEYKPGQWISVCGDYVAGPVLGRWGHNWGMVNCKACLALRDEITAERLLEAVERDERHCEVLRAWNDSGSLWDELWKCEGGVYRSKVCASGAFGVDWHLYDSREDAKRAVMETLVVIKQVA